MTAASVVAATLRVFLDCSSVFCHEEYLREEVEIGQYVRDRTDADVHVLVTSAQTGAGGQEYTLAFIGLGAFQSVSRTLKVTTDASDTDDRVRRKLESALTVGLLGYLVPDDVPGGLQVTATLDAGGIPTTLDPAHDPWKQWIFSVHGSLNIDSEQSTSERDWSLSVGADRITPEWKLTFATEINESRESFDLEEEDESPLSVLRKDKRADWLTVKGLGEHWSAGAFGHLRSSTFDNLEFEAEVLPAIEWNFFPYSEYTRRQLRMLYGLGVVTRRYYEVTLFDTLEETRTRQELSATFEQREPWGTLEGRIEASNYFPGLSTHRIELDGEVSLRIARGLSVNVEMSASRIRDQLSLPRRDASPEEVLLRVRQLASDFEARLEIGIEYRFGSLFAAIVNPRFGQ
jgi:hypothetical protein